MSEDFLLELRSEEIPARMQERARTDLASLFEARLKALNLPFTGIESYATPRRLALIVRGVAETTAAATEERKGPRADAPAQAIEGFLRSTGLTRAQLVERDDGKGNTVLFAVVERPGIAAGSVLASAITHVVTAFPWPKSMRWGAASASTESLRWVRPLQGIVALLGDKLVPVEVAGVKSGVATLGHRFHPPGAITIGSAADYIEELRARHVIVDGAERRNIIALGAKMAAQKAGLTLIQDEGLLFENAGLTEWPVPLLGRFDEAFLEVPPEVIQLTARVNQKYFVCADSDGKLANAFVCTANIDASDDGARIVEGNQKVLAARLSDAKFFYDTDRKTRLEDLRPKLEKIVFHEKLGTVADKVERVAKLARWLAEQGIVKADPDLAERAARLAKADLVTGMVGEFPELQGLMGGYYAAAQGEPAEVAEAVRDHYKPVGPGDEVPTAPVTVAVSLADKLDTLFGFFLISQKPSGSKDPFALRRAVLAVLSIQTKNAIRFTVKQVFWTWLYVAIAAAKTSKPSHGWTPWLEELLHSPNVMNVFDESHIIDTPSPAELEASLAYASATAHQKVASAVSDVLDFFADRLKVQQKEAGVRHDLIDAVFALGGEDDLVRLLARVHALQAFVTTEDGNNLLAGYKRAANILKKEGRAAPAHRHPGPVPGSTAPQAAVAQAEDRMPDPVRYDGGESGTKKELSYTPLPEEQSLIDALDSAEPIAAAAIAREDFEGAMAALATLRAPIDAFFDKVTVNDADPAKREARLDLLARTRGAVHQVADFSRIEG